MPLGQTPLVIAFANAIAQEESGGSATALSYRNNNPGNLVSWGSMPIVNGFAQFPTLTAGWQALYSQIETNIGRGLTTYEFFAGKPGVYAGYASVGSSASNNPIAYATFVAGQLGIDPSVPLNSLDPTTFASTAAPITTATPTTCADGTQPVSGLCDDGSTPSSSVSLSTDSSEVGGISLPVAVGIAGVAVFLWMYFND
jgi:hypothetical protein